MVHTPRTCESLGVFHSSALPLSSPGIQHWDSITWDFCSKTDCLRAERVDSAFRLNFYMLQILFLSFPIYTNPHLYLLFFLSLPKVNTCYFIEALHLCHHDNPLGK